MAVPSYLIVLASSCQMYSGTGRAVFDWIRFAKRDFRFSILMDIEVDLNFRIVREFCERHGVPLHVSRGLRLPGCSDTGVRQANAHLLANKYDFVECISWANASTNLSVLRSLNGASKLVYVPHWQPLWTVHDHETFFMTPIVFQDVLETADFVFVDSPAEMRIDAFKQVRRDKVHFVPLGVDTDRYRPSASPVRDHQILCVCDVREHRKRIELVLDAFCRAHSRDDRLRLVVCGMGSDELPVPAERSGAVQTLGYVEQEVLIDLYRTSALFMLMSDYEAFGLPIAEALCCGCPVLLNRLVTHEQLFSSLAGVTLTDNRDIEQTASLICQLAAAEHDRAAIARGAQQAFSLENTYGLKRSILLES